MRLICSAYRTGPSNRSPGARAIIDAWIPAPALVHRALPDGTPPVDRDAFPRRVARATLTSSFPIAEVGHALDPLRCFPVVAHTASAPGALPPRAPSRGMGLRVR